MVLPFDTGPLTGGFRTKALAPARHCRSSVMPVSVGASAQASFEQPLELLKDCHRRIESFLGVLSHVVARATDNHLDDEGRRALPIALRYFREAAPRHTQDEEQSLFPRLRQSANAEAQAALKRVQALEADHVRATKLHDAVNATGEQWLRDGQLPPMTLRTLQHQLEELHELYRHHIQIEDNQIFPLAGKTLTSSELASIGREMKARRAASPEPEVRRRQ